MSFDENHVRSPCTRVCVIDPISGYCRGCLRTLDEIAGWGVASPDQRRAILAALEERR
jgi:predicted Fe-S protein YdhL (DUF1289 family)